MIIIKANVCNKQCAGYEAVPRLIWILKDKVLERRNVRTLMLPSSNQGRLFPETTHP